MEGSKGQENDSFQLPSSGDVWRYPSLPEPESQSSISSVSQGIVHDHINKKTLLTLVPQAADHSSSFKAQA